MRLNLCKETSRTNTMASVLLSLYYWRKLDTIFGLPFMYLMVMFFSPDAFLSSSSVRKSFKIFTCIGVWSLIIEYRAVLGFPINIFLFLRTVRTSRSFGNTTFIKRGYLPAGFGFPTRKNVTAPKTLSTAYYGS